MKIKRNITENQFGDAENIGDGQGVTFNRTAKRRPLFTFSSAYIALVLLLGLIQLVMGADHYALAMAVYGSIICTIPAMIFGARDLPATINILIGFRYATSALVTKTLLGEGIDQGLYAPSASFSVVASGITAVVIAALIAHKIWPKKPLLTPDLNRQQLSAFAWMGVVLGAMFFIVVSVLHFYNASGQLLSFFADGYVLMLASWFILDNVGSGKPARLSVRSTFGLALIIFVGIIGNSREQAALGFLAIIVTILAFRIKISVRQIITGAIVAAYFVLFVSPAILKARQEFYVGSSIGDMIISTTSSLIEYTLNGGAPSVDAGDPNKKYLLQYVPDKYSFLGRLVNVQQLDFVVKLVQGGAYIGYDRLWAELLDLLPGPLVSDKPTLLTPDFLLNRFGIVNDEQSYIETTAFGQAFVYGGYSSVFFVVLIPFFFVFLLFRLFCQRVDNSLLAVLLISTHAHVISAGGIGSLYLIALRLLPFQILYFYLFRRLFLVSRISR
jgi:hypothetical protein